MFVYIITLYADLFLKYKCGNMSNSLTLLNWRAKGGWVSGAIGGPQIYSPTDPCNWAAKWRECPACLIPLCYVSQNREERKKHMIQCDGANLDCMFDPVCPNRGHCKNRDVDHWSTMFHYDAPKEDVRPITNLHNRNWLTWCDHCFNTISYLIFMDFCWTANKFLFEDSPYCCCWKYYANSAQRFKSILYLSLGEGYRKNSVIFRTKS